MTIEYAAALFDCDGTLVDSEGIAVQAIVDCVGDLGVCIPLPEAQRMFVGSGIDNTLAAIEKRIGRPPPAGFEVQIRERMAAQFRTSLAPIAGAYQVLQAIRKPCAVVSNGPLPKMKLTLGLTGLAGFFGERLFSAYEVGIFKPDPGLYLYAAKRMKVQPSHCLVVEDSAIGIEAGLAAGMQVCAIGEINAHTHFGDRVTQLHALIDLLDYLC